jgi:hypothetical protein
VDGRVVGSWRRTLGKDAVTIEINPFVRLAGAEHDAVRHAALHYGRFLNKPVVLVER